MGVEEFLNTLTNFHPLQFLDFLAEPHQRIFVSALEGLNNLVRNPPHRIRLSVPIAIIFHGLALEIQEAPPLIELPVLRPAVDV